MQNSVYAICWSLKLKQLCLYTLELIGTSGPYISWESEDHKCLKKSFPVLPQLVVLLYHFCSQKVLLFADSSMHIANGSPSAAFLIERGSRWAPVQSHQGLWTLSKTLYSDLLFQWLPKSTVTSVFRNWACCYTLSTWFPQMVLCDFLKPQPASAPMSNLPYGRSVCHCHLKTNNLSPPPSLEGEKKSKLNVWDAHRFAESAMGHFGLVCE